jgi:gamma-glutamyltranspeptidase/glutathione hydrolase
MEGQYDQYRMGRLEATRKEVCVAAGRGAVASVSREATEFAVSVLRDGGNAFDAAFSLAFALAICHPQAGNLGGGGYVVFKQKGSKKPRVFNYRERSPGAARKEHYLLEDRAADPEKTAFGPASVCVPGTVSAFFELHERYGVLNRRDLLIGLSRLARDGVIITEYQARCLNRLAPKLNYSPESRRLYVKEGGTFRQGDVLTNPHLADTFDMLALEGARAFYRGKIAEKIEKDLVENGGFLTVGDLQNYEIREAKPISSELGGCVVWSVPPEGGGSILIEIINILNRPEFLKIKPLTLDWYHYLAQAFKIAFIDRMTYMGDGAVEKIGVYRSIFETRDMQTRFGYMDPERDTPTAVYVKRLYGDDYQEVGFPSTGAETTHFSVVDADGNAVSNSYTLNLRYGSKWAIEGTGMLMNGSIDSFSFEPGKPNYFGVMGNPMNLFEPNKRPASNMTPVLVTQKGVVRLLIGSPGGPTIPTSLAAILFSILIHGVDPSVALGSARVHHQAWPDVINGERDEALLEKLVQLKSKGYIIRGREEPIGDMHAVVKSEKRWVGISDYRREGFAAAY